jgi:hypothetical protein
MPLSSQLEKALHRELAIERNFYLLSFGKVCHLLLEIRDNQQLRSTTGL